MSNHSIKSKSLKKLLNKFCQITKNEKRPIKNKTDKNWKRIGTTYCFGCKNYTHNFKSQEIKMTKAQQQKIILVTT